MITKSEKHAVAKTTAWSICLFGLCLASCRSFSLDGPVSYSSSWKESIAVTNNSFRAKRPQFYSRGMRSETRKRSEQSRKIPSYCNDFGSRPSLLSIRGGSSSTSLNLLPASIATLVSGSVAGAIGVGVAFPFDTLKTKVSF